MDQTTSCICISSLWCLEQCRLLENKFNRIFLSIGMATGLRALKSKLHKISHAGLTWNTTLYALQNDSFLFGFINMVITTSYISD